MRIFHKRLGSALFALPDPLSGDGQGVEVPSHVLDELLDGVCVERKPTRSRARDKRRRVGDVWRLLGLRSGRRKERLRCPLSDRQQGRRRELQRGGPLGPRPAKGLGGRGRQVLSQLARPGRGLAESSSSTPHGRTDHTARADVSDRPTSNPTSRRPSNGPPSRTMAGSRRRTTAPSGSSDSSPPGARPGCSAAATVTRRAPPRS